MRSFLLAAAILLTAASASNEQAISVDQAENIAEQAVAEALTLPPGYKRDVVLRTVSRNLRWHGQPDAGVRAARAMTDQGVDEVPLGERPRMPRYVPLTEVFPTGSLCDLGPWRLEKGGEAKSSEARKAWARECLLERDFHWIGLPSANYVKSVASGLPASDEKAAILAMLIRRYGDAETLRFVQAEIDRDGERAPIKARAVLAAMLSEPAALYRLGRKQDAIAAARTARIFAVKAEFIALLLRDNDAATAIMVFDNLGATPPEFAERCFDWFSPIGGLRLAYIGNARNPSPGLGAFLDRLPASALFRRICPKGLDAELAVEHLLAAGRLDAAISRARKEGARSFLLVDTLLQAGQVRLRDSELALARTHALEAGKAVPLFDPGDPINPAEANRSSITIDTDASPEKQPKRNFGEASGNTGRRFEVIQLLAATGAVAEADALARAQPAGGLRAVALSAAVAGRAGMRFDEQAPTLDTISKDEL